MVSESALITLFGFITVIALLLVLISKYKWHVFLSLLVPILLFGLLPGIDRDGLIEAFNTGFGKTLGDIGVVIVLGSIIAEVLKETGAVQAITRSMINLVGKHRMPLALTFTGFVLGVAVFSDVAYVILNPLVHAAALEQGVSMSIMATGLVGSLQLTHAIVPPTPGPLAAAALVGADVGLVILYGGLAALVGGLASWAWGQTVGPTVNAPPSSEFVGRGFDEEGQELELPSTLNAYLPIAVPIVFIAGQSVTSYLLPAEHAVNLVMGYLGWPVVALTLGLWLAYRNVRGPENRSAMVSRWVENGLRGSAMILVVTGLGGSLSQILRGTPTVEFIAEAVANAGIPAIFLPFILGIVGNIITGSTTVGVITAGSLVAPMLGTLGLSPEAAMLAAASGAVIIKYVNSSYFWVATSLSQLEVNQAILMYGGATLVGGVATFLTVYGLWLVGLV